MAEGVAARAAAVQMLNAVLGEGRMLADLPEPDLPPGDRARARRLAEEVLRRVEPADRVLAPLMRKAPPLPVLNGLRLAVVELSLGAAPHGVVNAAVALVRQGKRTQHLSGLVNAVLRQVEPAALATQPVQKLPRWMRQPMVHAFGREAVAAIEAVHALTPPLDLTLRDGAEAPEGLALPTGSLRLAAGGQVSALPGYAAGGWWVQDAAAALPARLMAAQPGERVLDLCAAPGGKTMQLAAAGAQVTALDISGPRLARLRENLTRTGLPAEVVTADALVWTPEAPFDAVLLDAPCSATGTVRRHPDLPFVKDGSELDNLTALQDLLIDRALGFLKPGGRLVFATCSLLPAEGEDRIAAALTRHPGLRADLPDLQGVEPAWTSGGGLRLRPDYWADLGGMDGFFCARLTLPG
ncbi:RsmB/NOP family class I SAM-dependent RNA methyltransferase [Neotabrizicola sp. VNH66]|uniref:RsmB/NOP family class I SAM-dependent RNA methyltransferase n=1 Tax=Neotabrizicola sp. VNH66 TaxID=3400918 RepID=UPI003C0D5AE3